MRTIDTARRCRGATGSGAVMALVVIASTVGGAVVWSSGEVDRATSLRTTARIIAFEAARVGAQQVDVDMLRRGVADTVILDPDAAQQAAVATVHSELVRRGLNGTVAEIVVDGDQVGVVVDIDHSGRRVSGHGRARAVIGR